MTRLLLALSLLTDAPGASDPARPHALDVKAFASTLAITKMASDRCADILIDMNLVRELGQRAHYAKEQDAPLLAAAARTATAVLAQAVAEAPSPQVWCDAMFRLYGPEGRLIPGLMARRPR